MVLIKIQNQHVLFRKILQLDRNYIRSFFLTYFLMFFRNIYFQYLFIINYFLHIESSKLLSHYQILILNCFLRSDTSDLFSSKKTEGTTGAFGPVKCCNRGLASLAIGRKTRFAIEPLSAFANGPGHNGLVRERYGRYECQQHGARVRVRFHAFIVHYIFIAGSVRVMGILPGLVSMCTQLRPHSSRRTIPRMHANPTTLTIWNQ